MSDRLAAWRGGGKSTIEKLLESQPSFSGPGAMDALKEHYRRKDFGTAEVPVNTWELFALEVEKDILESSLPVVAAMTLADKKKLIGNLGDEVTDDDYNQPALDAGVRQLYAAMVNGATSVRVAVPTLRHTIYSEQ